MNETFTKEFFDNSYKFRISLVLTKVLGTLNLRPKWVFQENKARQVF